jgi:hypothetical protein
MEVLVALMLAIIYGAVFFLIYLFEADCKPRVDVSPRAPEGPWVRFNKVHFG